MPTRTEIIISIGEVLECLPPGKSFRRKRYNSFDANQSAAAIEAGNEENVAPPSGPTCLPEFPGVGGGGGMKSREPGAPESEPQILTVRRKTRGSEDGGTRRQAVLDDHPGDEDDEVSFNPDTVGGSLASAAAVENGSSNGGTNHNHTTAEDSNGKVKGKRKSSAEKFLEDNVNYFQLEVLPSKTRSTKPIENGDGEGAGEAEGYYNSFLDFLKSKGVEGKDGIKNGGSADVENGESSESDRGKLRSRHQSGPIGSGQSRRSRPRTSSFHQSPSRSDSEDSVRNQRSRSQFRKARSRSSVRSRSRIRELSPSESEGESISSKNISSKLSKKNEKKRFSKVSESSDDESECDRKSSRSRSKGDTCSPSPGKRARRSELDKLLEAVDTSFHFETAAAAAKRLNSSPGSLGPLEIDVSDSNCDSEADSHQPVARKKRKISESDGELEEKRKKAKGSAGNDLLKTMSPQPCNNKKLASPKHEETESEAGDCVWDGWEALQDTLTKVNSDPVEIDDLHFSFEITPFREGWFQTYSRQDTGEDLVFYPESRGFPFQLPYEMNYSSFLPYKPDSRDKFTKCSAGTSKKVLEVCEEKGKGGKFKKRKISDSESTDSDRSKRGRQKFGPKFDQLQDSSHRVSPRCHASTKDERELHYSGILPFINYDETSNDSVCSTKSRQVKRESVGEYLQLAANLDRFLRSPEEFEFERQDGGDDSEMSTKVAKEKASADKVSATVPTRSRISSEELLRTKKEKPKKKKERLVTTDPPMMDQIVANHVDNVLLDLLEEELPTVPFDSSVPGTDPLSLLESYHACNSLTVCNSRWLRPSRPAAFPGSKFDDSKQATTGKGSSGAHKPKRFVIYKEDLPGFKYDNDIEPEKLPVSKRFLAKAGVKEEKEEKKPDTSVEKSSPPAKSKKGGGKKQALSPRKETTEKVSKKELLASVKEEAVSDAESVSSVGSSAPRKNVKKVQKLVSPKSKKRPTSPVKPSPIIKKKGSPQKKKEEVSKVVSPPKEKSDKTIKKASIKTKQLKMDKFVTKKKANNSSPGKSTCDLGRRATTLQAKNYSELESDTESLFESKVPYRSPHVKTVNTKKGGGTQTKSRTR